MSAPRALSWLGSRIAASVRRTVETLCSPFGWLTLLSCCIGIVAFYSFEWTQLRIGLAKVIAAIFRTTGHVVVRRLVDVRVDNVPITITAECTYVDWILTAVPFVWRRGPARANIGRALVLILVVTVVNLGRVCIAIAGQLRGLSWFWSHDALDDILWYPSLILMIITWLVAAERSVGRTIAHKSTWPASLGMV